MKISRGTYLVLLSSVVLLILFTIEQFSTKIWEELKIPGLIVIFILLFIGAIITIHDKEFIKTTTDERTKKVDHLAGYYSWWATVLFVFIMGFIAYILEFTLGQFLYLVATEMFLSMILFHMYFNFKGKF